MRRIDKVMFVTTRKTSVLQYMVRDMAHGFRKLGLDVDVAIERWPGDPRLEPTRAWFKPDMVFQMDHLRGENPNWKRGPAYVSWIQDALPHLFGDSGKRLAKTVGEDDFIFTSFPGLREKMIAHGYPAERIWHLPVGVNTDMFYRDGNPTGEFTVGFPCNVGDSATSSNPERLARRTEPVGWLLELGVNVKLWGRGWELNPIYKKHWHGSVENGPALRRVYSSCHAILHANSDTNLHQRVFESIACETPVLMYALPRTGNPEEEVPYKLPGVCTFHSQSDLGDAIDESNWARNPLGWAVRFQFLRNKIDYKQRCEYVLGILKVLGGIEECLSE